MESTCYLLMTETPRFLSEVERYSPLLTDEDLVYLDTVKNDHRRHEYIVSRGLLKTLLAKQTGVAANHWSFVRDNNGRLDAVPNAASLNIPDVNISHTKGAIAVGLCTHGRIGVDVEHAARKVKFEQLAKRFFSLNEQHWIDQQTNTKAAFFELWTIKEAYLKAIGTGISDQLAFAEFSKAPNNHWQWTAPVGHSDKLHQPSRIQHQIIHDIHFSYVLTHSNQVPRLEVLI